MLYRQVFDKISREFRSISHIIVNFTGFCRFTWNSRLSNRTKYQTPGWYCELLHLHYTNWRLKTCTWWLHFSSLSPKDDLKIFLISSPAMSTPRKSWPEKTEGIWPTGLQGSTGETAGWIGEGDPVPVKGKQPKLPKNVWNGASHLPIIKRSRGRCKVCSSSGVQSRSNVKCERCDLVLCLNKERNCFYLYHLELPRTKTDDWVQ